MKEQIQLLNIVFNFLNSLSDEQLQSLLSHQVNLKLSDLSIKKKKLKKRETTLSQEDITKICNNIEKCSTEEETLKFINKLDLTCYDLKAIAKQFNISITSRDKKQVLIDKIIEGSIGAKLKYDALLNIDLD